MTVKQAFKIIHWYDVYMQETLSTDREDYIIYHDVLDTLRDCYDVIPGMNGVTYHNYYLYRISEDELKLNAFESSLGQAE
jgi:hypothetical protein